MNRDVFLDAVGYLDADLLAQHLQAKQKLQRKPKRGLHVWKWSALVAACLCVVVLVGALLLPKPSAPPSSNETRLESGFQYQAGSAESPSNFCAYKSETNEFDINDVTLDFFYGGYYYNGAEHAIENYLNCPTFDLYFVNDQGDQYLVKHVEENFVSEKYSCEIVFDEKHDPKKIKFNHSETLTIPPELFTEPSGCVWFEVRGINTWNPDSLGRITGICLFYKVENGKVRLYSQDPN